VSVSELIALLYGRGQLDLRMPGHAKVTLVEKGKLKKINDPAAAVRQALSEPINSPSLNALARGRKSACILICDITRPVPNHLFLRPMVETLVASGILSAASPSWSPPVCIGQTLAKNSLNWLAIRGSWRRSGLRTTTRATKPITSISA
jgi:hypothetical protein